MPGRPPPALAGHGPAIELTPQDNAITRRSTDIHNTKELFANTAGVVNDDSSLEDQPDSNLHATRSTPEDAAGMKRMGKDQQLVRRFQQFSIISFVAIATAAWEIGLFVISPGLVDGGRSGLVYNTIWNFIGFGPVYLSMAEMASMAPIAGAQCKYYDREVSHTGSRADRQFDRPLGQRVRRDLAVPITFTGPHTDQFSFRRFAPENCQRFLSYLTGSVRVLRQRTRTDRPQMDVHDRLASRERHGHLPCRLAGPNHDSRQQRELRYAYPDYHT